MYRCEYATSEQISIEKLREELKKSEQIQK
nr:MAG TPA: hypothetical protein [Caudoviricetes sp.]